MTITTQAFRLLDQIGPTKLAEFQCQTGLANFFWEATYLSETPAHKSLTQRLAEAEGVVIFLHGWDGNHRIWEDLPARIVKQLPHVICLNPDVNGFGESPFMDNRPKGQQASLSAGMAAVEKWLEVIEAWPQAHRTTKPFYLFVGHSMGGGMVFYKNQPQWTHHKYGCYAMAPGIFYRNWLYGWLYKIVGLGILFPHVTPIKNIIARLIVKIAMRQASRVAKYEHEHTFYASSYQTLSKTLRGIGSSPPPTRTDWSPYRVALSHADLLVPLGATLRMLSKFGFIPAQIRVFVGDHYFFSYDSHSPVSHHYNRETILQDLVIFCQQLAESSH